jgi:hypothetical protein
MEHPLLEPHRVLGERQSEVMSQAGGDPRPGIGKDPSSLIFRAESFSPRCWIIRRAKKQPLRRTHI